MADENVVLVTFEDESKVYQAASILEEASAQERITLHAVAVVQRMEDGTIRVKEGDTDTFPEATWTTGAVGAARDTGLDRVHARAGGRVRPHGHSSGGRAGDLAGELETRPLPETAAFGMAVGAEEDTCTA